VSLNRLCLVVSFVFIFGCGNENSNPKAADQNLSKDILLEKSVMPSSDDSPTIYSYERASANTPASNWTKKLIKLNVGYFLKVDNGFVSAGKSTSFNFRFEIPFLYNHRMRLAVINAIDANYNDLIKLEFHPRSDCEYHLGAEELCYGHADNNTFYNEIFNGVILFTKDGSHPVVFLKNDAIPSGIKY